MLLRSKKLHVCIFWMHSSPFLNTLNDGFSMRNTSFWPTFIFDMLLLGFTPFKKERSQTRCSWTQTCSEPNAFQTKTVGFPAFQTVVSYPINRLLLCQKCHHVALVAFFDKHFSPAFLTYIHWETIDQSFSSGWWAMVDCDAFKPFKMQMQHSKMQRLH